ncbi:MAG TPA: Na+/H+ antiporter NhaA [Gaiellaceae bacterium]|nr:Na+/H+ antiporter NhaA [Gaiellaceae bacterium]
MATVDSQAQALGRTAWVRNIAQPLRSFLETEAGSALALLAAAAAALVWANSPWGGSYDDLWGTELSVRLGEWELAEDVRTWVNDGLMTFFFFVVGLEIRRELDMGELRDRRRVGAPVLAALGGMLLPAALYLAIARGGAQHGWGIVITTDTAFALGVIALLGRRCPMRLRVFVLTLAIADDVGALAVIGGVYTEHVDLVALGVALGLFGVVLGLRRLQVWRTPAYVLVGAGIWLAALQSGIHPTLAGVALGLLVDAYPPGREELERATLAARLFREQPTAALAREAALGVEAALSPNERLQYRLHPWVGFVVVPLFALANAGVDVGGGKLADALTSPVGLAIVLALVVGKPLGVLAGAFAASRRPLGPLPLVVPWAPLGAGAVACGIGFTLSLFIADLAFTGERLEHAKTAVLAAAVLATAASALAFRLLAVLPPALRGRGAVAGELVDLDLPVDPELDHVRGGAEAPVTLVEYGDYQCPYCGRAEAVVRELLAEFGDDLRYVWRHLPLQDVHANAQLAAEAAEAAAAQGRFWEMHDLLIGNQEALRVPDLRAYAQRLGLDEGRFWDDLRGRAFAGRVARDVESADLSRVAGTPTFFVDGRRHVGEYDAATLRAVVRAARAAARR